MSINFYPCRIKMSKEIGRCIAMEQLDTLLSFCNSCIYRIFEKAQVNECYTCEVQQAVRELERDVHEAPVTERGRLDAC